MKTYLVQLESHDDVISTRDKISWSKAPRVLLVWPRQGRVLERRVDLMLVQRYCQQLGMQLALVSSSHLVRAVAADLGIPVFSSVLRAQAVPWRRARRRRLQWPQGRPLRPAEELRRWRSGLRARPRWPLWARVTVFLAGILAFMALVFFFMPGARVELAPARQEQKLTIAVWANTGMQAPNLSGGVPAYPVAVVVEGREQAPSTGVTFIADHNATGEIELTNLTDQAVLVPVGSVALTVGDRPVRFLTTQPVEVAAGPGAKATVAVRAALPGVEGNVRAGEIQAMEGPLGLRVMVNNPQPTHGGSARTAPAPSAQDYKTLRSQLLEKLRATALEELQAQMQPGQRLIAASLRQADILAEERNPGVDQPADFLQLTLRVEYQAWMVQDADLGAVGLAALDANLPPGFEAEPGSLRVDYATEPAFDDAGNARWMIEVRRALVAEWSRERVIRLVQGRSPQEAAAALQAALALDRAPRLELFPSWWIRMPFLPFRIEVLGT